MAVNPETTVRKVVSLPKAQAKQVEDFWHRERLRSESEAIRRLIEIGLLADRQSSGKADLPTQRS
jgi:metal-responsive CopG/Arc/MetJ family transcriptional regulator